MRDLYHQQLKETSPLGSCGCRFVAQKVAHCSTVSAECTEAKTCWDSYFTCLLQLQWEAKKTNKQKMVFILLYSIWPLLFVCLSFVCLYVSKTSTTRLPCMHTQPAEFSVRWWDQDVVFQQIAVHHWFLFCSVLIGIARTTVEDPVWLGCLCLWCMKYLIWSLYLFLFFFNFPVFCQCQEDGSFIHPFLAFLPRWCLVWGVLINVQTQNPIIKNS